MCALPATFIPRLPLLLFHTVESRRVFSLPHGGKHLGKFGERQNSELSTFLFLFFFLRNFFPPTADDFTILGGGGGVEILAFALPTLQVPDKALHSSKSQSFRVS